MTLVVRTAHTTTAAVLQAAVKYSVPRINVTPPDTREFLHSNAGGLGVLVHYVFNLVVWGNGALLAVIDGDSGERIRLYLEHHTLLSPLLSRILREVADDVYILEYWGLSGP